MFASILGLGFAGIFLLLVLSATIYMIPTMVGYIRNVRNLGSIVTVNIFAGWTFIGWVVAMAMATSSNYES